jgi:RNA polymerase sigma-70 factor (ECF subfamily)
MPCGSGCKPFRIASRPNIIVFMVYDERSLLERARNQEAPALQEFVEQYKQQVYFLALDLTGNHHDAEDLSQEVFMKAFTAIQTFRGDSKLSSWLHRITVNTFIDQKRKSSFRIFQLQRTADKDNETKEPEAVYTGPDPQQSLEQKRLQSDIRNALVHLSAQQKSVFVLRHYQELTLKEIAEILHISEGTVKSLMFRAIRKMQKALSGYRDRPALEDLQ